MESKEVRLLSEWSVERMQRMGEVNKTPGAPNRWTSLRIQQISTVIQLPQLNVYITNSKAKETTLDGNQ